MMSEILPRLHYPSVSGPKLLPEWAYFFMRLGYKLAAYPKDNHHFVIGLAIPSRAFSSILVATGIMLARVNDENPENDQQAQFIRSLKPGTQVHIRDNSNRKIRGVLEGFTDYFNKTHVVIKTAGSQKNSYPLDIYASRITISETEVNLPDKLQRGYTLESPSGFLECCIGKDAADGYHLNSGFEVLIVGKKTAIKSEACEQLFICGNTRDKEGAMGSLQEVVRVRQFSGVNSSYRAQCISSTARNIDKKTGNREPSVVIFDGAIAYIKHWHKWEASHHVALLDRTERQFADAIELMNQNYTYRLLDEFAFTIRIPSSIEMMIYQE
jgi:hypothetical protein